MPKCVYMGDHIIFEGSHPNLPDLYNRAQQPSQLTPSERTLMAMDLAALDLGQAASSAPPQRAFFTTAASTAVTKRFA